MDARSTEPDARPTTGLFVLGAGWVLPSALVALGIVLLYLPAHGGVALGGNGVIAAVAALYAVALSVAVPRVARGAILRLGGSREPIALLGIGGTSLLSGSIRARWRLLAVLTSVAVSAVSAGIAFALASQVQAGSYAHAVASLAAVTNGLLAAAVLVPFPRTQGWAALLAVADAIGAGPRSRVRYTVGMARLVTVVAALVTTIFVIASGHLMLLVIGPWLGLTLFGQTRDLVARDAEIRYLSARHAGDLSRPILAVAAPDDRLDALVWDGALPETVWVVERFGEFVGAVGPRQRVPQGKGVHRCAGDAMVPISAIPPVPATSAATELVPTILRHGFALVSIAGGLGYVEEHDLARRIRIWEKLIDPLATRRAPAVVEAPSDPGEQG